MACFPNNLLMDVFVFGKQTMVWTWVDMVASVAGGMADRVHLASKSMVMSGTSHVISGY